MASALESSSQQYGIDCNALLSELQQVDPLGEVPNVVQGEENMNDAYNASLLTAQKFVQEKLSSSSVTATAATSALPHATEHEIPSSSAHEAHDRESGSIVLNQPVSVPHRPSVQVTANRNDLPLLTQPENCWDWFHIAKDTQQSTGVSTTELVNPDLLTKLRNHTEASATLNCGMTLTNVVKACVQYIHGHTTVLTILTHLARTMSFTSLDSSYNADKFGKSLDAILKLNLTFYLAAKAPSWRSTLRILLPQVKWRKYS